MLVLGFFQLENDVLAELLVVFAEFELFAGGEILLLNGGDVAHDARLGGDAGHVGALSLCHDGLRLGIGSERSPVSFRKERGKYIEKGRNAKSNLKIEAERVHSPAYFGALPRLSFLHHVHRRSRRHLQSWKRR